MRLPQVCLLILLAVFAVSIPRVQAGDAPQHPNIIVIMADDLGYGDVGYHGAIGVKTPNIDKLASESLRFSNGYCSASTCTPTRYSFITGRYAFRDNGTGIAPPNATALIKPGTPTIASLLKSTGYATAVIGKWHLGLGKGAKPDWNGELNPGPLEIGFDHCLLLPTTPDRVPSVYVDDHHVLNLDPKDPLWVTNNQNLDHQPTGKDPAVRAKLKMDWSHGHNDTVWNGIGRIGYFGGGMSARWRDEDLSTKWISEADQWITAHKDHPFFLFYASNDIHVPRMPNPRFQGKSKLGYRGDAIVELDWQVGEIMKLLDKLNIADNTLVVFCSDNGPVLDDGYKDGAVEGVRRTGHHPAGPDFSGGKYSLFEGGTRIPFLTHWPGHITPGDSDKFVCTIDLAASMAALVGAKIPDGGCNDSLNLIDALLGKPDAKGRTEMVEQPNRGNLLALRIGDWKILQHKPHGKGDNPAKHFALFNLKEDPGEHHDLAAQDPDRVKAMAEELQRIRNSKQTRP